MNIISLKAENFKRLVAVTIKPDGSLVQITGRNGAGKSSCLDAIAAALGGKQAAPSKPIRAGATHAQVVVDLGDIKVTRRWTSDDRSTLVVESADGLRHPSPQAVLDDLVGRLSFDPLGFSRMNDKEQARTLRELVGLDTTKLTQEYDRVFAQRTEVGRAGKALEAQLAGLPPPPADVPDEEVSIAELAARQREAMGQKIANDAERREANYLRDRLAQLEATVRVSQAALEKAQKALVQAERDLFDAQQVVKMAEEASAKAAEKAAALVDPDVDAIAAELRAAEGRSAAVRAKKARAAKATEQQAKRDEWAKLSEQLKKIEEQKAQALREAKFPVEGLSLEGDVVTFKGLPLEQASSAEQLRVGLAMGAALNPKLRVILVRDGSLLDAEGLRMVAEWAEREKMQVLMERVADGTSCGVVIEDGQVVGAQPEAEAPAEQPGAAS